MIRNVKEILYTGLWFNRKYMLFDYVMHNIEPWVKHFFNCKHICHNIPCYLFFYGNWHIHVLPTTWHFYDIVGTTPFFTIRRFIESRPPLLILFFIFHKNSCIESIKKTYTNIQTSYRYQCWPVCFSLLFIFRYCNQWGRDR
jgi:hypothetical protein